MVSWNYAVLRRSLIVFACVIFFSASAFGRTYPIFIAYTVEPLSIFKKWNPLALYLSQATGETIKIVPFSYDDFVREVGTGRPALVVTNLLNYTLLREKAGLIPVGMAVWNVAGKPVSEYGAVIFSKKGGGINTPNDIVDKVLMIPSKKSLAALIGLKTLGELGVKITDLKSIKSVKTHEHVVYGVLNGVADVGIIRTSTLEEMTSRKKINLEDIQVINRKLDDFPYIHSTPLYPNWLLCVTGSVPKNLLVKIKKALISLDPTHQVSVHMELWGWKSPEEVQLPNISDLIEMQKIIP